MDSQNQNSPEDKHIYDQFVSAARVLPYDKRYVVDYHAFYQLVQPLRSEVSRLSAEVAALQERNEELVSKLTETEDREHRYFQKCEQLESRNQVLTKALERASLELEVISGLEFWLFKRKGIQNECSRISNDLRAALSQK